MGGQQLSEPIRHATMGWSARTADPEVAACVQRSRRRSRVPSGGEGLLSTMRDYSPTQSASVALHRRDVGVDAGPATWDDVASVTSGLPLPETCSYLSGVARLAANPVGLIAAQTDIVACVEPARLQLAVTARLQRQDKAALVHPSQLVAAWRELALHGCQTAGGSFDDPGVRELFWHWLMMITEALAEGEARGLEGAEPSITGDFAQSLMATASYLTSRDIPALLMARHYELLDHTLQLPGIRESDNWVDIEAEVEHLVGCNRRTYHAIGNVLGAAAIADQSSASAQRVAMEMSSPDTFPAPAIDRAVLRRIFDDISVTLPQLAAKYQEMEREKAWLPDPLPLQERPLVSLQDGSYCPSLPQFVVERFTLGMYHLLFNSRAGPKEQGRFKAFWGELLERYVDSLFLPLFPHSGSLKRLWLDKELPYRRNGESDPSDILIDCGEVLVLVEVTHSSFTRQSLVAGDPDKVREDIRKTLIDKAKQIDSVIGDFRNGRFSLGDRGAATFKRILPAIILWHDVPLFEPALEHFYSALESQGTLRGPDILPPRVLLLGECEGMLAAVSAGESLLDALNDKRWVIRGESFGSFRHRIDRPLHSLRHPVLKRAMEEQRENVKATLFGATT